MIQSSVYLSALGLDRAVRHETRLWYIPRAVRDSLSEIVFRIQLELLDGPQYMVKRLLKRIGKGLELRLAPTRRSRYLPGIPGRVHDNDLMLFDDSRASVENYLRAGRSAVDIVEAALVEAGRSYEATTSCLDFGCGHGRVLRLLCQRIPADRVTACDVDKEGVRFCAAEFGVQPLVSKWDIREIPLGSYDLIWSGSVFTHLDVANCDILLERLGRSLLPGGLLVFSMHGEYSLGHLEHLYEQEYGHEAETIRREVGDEGISFRHYNASWGDFAGTYGMTWHTKEYLQSRAEALSDGALRMAFFRPQGWDHHHDVIAFEKNPSPGGASI